MYSDISERIKTAYRDVAYHDVSGLVVIGGIAQYADENDMEVSDVQLDQYRQWSVIQDSDGIGGAGEDQFEWAIEELVDPDSTYDREEARHVFQHFVNERIDQRRKFEKGLSLVEMKFNSGWSLISKEEQFARKDGDGWQPYVGPRGGVGWTDGEDVNYDMDRPPEDIDQEALDGFLDSLSEEDRQQAREELGIAEEQPEDENSGQSGMQDRELAENERAVPLEIEDDLEVGDEVAIDGQKYEIVGVEGDPSAGLGDRAGYAELDDGSVVSLFGNVDDDYIPDDVDTAHALKEVDGRVEQALPEPTGSQDPSDWNVNWTDLEPKEDRNEDRDLDRLTERQKEIFMNEWKAAAPSEESVEEVSEVIEVNKQVTMSTHGQKLDRLVKAAAGVEGELREGDFEDSEEPTPEEIESFGVFMEASQQFFEQNYGEQGTVHRGLGDHSNENVIQALSDAYVQDELSDVSFELRDNPASVWTTDEKLASSFEKGLIAEERIDAEDVLAQPEALLDVSHGGGPDWNEGEVDIPGWDMQMSISDFEVGSSGIGLLEALQDPVEVVKSRSGGFNTIVTLGGLIARFASPEMAEKFHTTLQEGDIPKDLENSPVMRQLADSYSLSDVLEFASKEADILIDLREDESDWLHEASESIENQSRSRDGDGSDTGNRDELMNQSEFTGSYSKAPPTAENVDYLARQQPDTYDIPQRVVKISGGEMADGWWESIVENGVAGWKHAETDEFVPADDAHIESDLTDDV
jgi:hypothetical protein